MFRKDLAPKTIEEIWRELPKVDLQGGVPSEPVDESGDLQVLYYVVNHASREVYDAYLQAMKQAGFSLCSHIGEQEEDPAVNAAFRKDDLAVYINYSKFWKRLYIEAGVDFFTPDWTGAELFANVPKPDGMRFVGEPEDYGAGNYVLCMDEAQKETYESYLCALQDAGFEKLADNGPEGLCRSVYTQTWRKGRLVLHVTLVVKKKKLYLSACYDTPISERLYNREGRVKNRPAMAHTTLHQMEMWTFGNSFVIQLKNGHFLISDGGWDCEIRYLIDYLESLTPKGEKPVVEGWFISHGHRDHCGVLRAIGGHPELAERIYVDGVYFCEPNDLVTSKATNVRGDMSCLKRGTATLRTTKGTVTELYRPVTGQRYYFDDITVDVMMTQEQLRFYEYDGLTNGDYNDSSTWLMATIEGQKVLLGGDGDRGGMRFIMDTYDREDMKLDMFTVLHHTMNTWDVFTDYCTVKTALFTRRNADVEYNAEANRHLMESVEEWFVPGDGTRVFTFPYTVGRSVCLPHFDWIYHKDRERPVV